MSRAAVHTTPGNPVEIRDVEIADPGAHELLVRIVAAGVCHSDLSVHNGKLPRPGPVVLGHEGAGVVEGIGSGVTDFQVGDQVVLSWVPQCGTCYFCRKGHAHMCPTGVATASRGSSMDGIFRTTLDGAPLPRLFGVGCFADYTTVPDIAAVRVSDVDLSVASLIGCAVLTGAGAAMNTADIAEGDTVAVLGCGGVGLNVLQGAKLAGACDVIAIDLNKGNLDLAPVFGATHVVDAGTTDALQAVQDLTDGRGADVVFEVIGSVDTCAQALEMTRAGGQTVLVGVPDPTTVMELAVFRSLVRSAKAIKGCWYGSADVRRDIPILLDAYRDNRIVLDPLVGRTIALEELDLALKELGTGSAARSVVVM